MSEREERPHPMGAINSPTTSTLNDAIVVDTYDGKIHVEWDPTAAVTPIGQLPFFIQYLKVGGLFEPWVNSCPLSYRSNNAQKKS